jgi:hypothetical protein
MLLNQEGRKRWTVSHFANGHRSCRASQGSCCSDEDMYAISGSITAMAHDHCNESDRITKSKSGYGRNSWTGSSRLFVLCATSGLSYTVGNCSAMEVLSTIRVKLGQRDVVISVVVGLVCAFVSFMIVDRIMTIAETAGGRAQERPQSTEGNKANN